MNRRLSALAAAALLCSAAASFAQTRDLNVVSWGGAYQDGQREVYFKPFAAAGTKVTDEAWDGGLGVLRTKIKGGNNNWDVVQVEADELEVGCDEGLYEKLDVAKIGGAARYLPGTVHACGVGAIIYNLVLAYDGDKLKTAPNGWADFFDTAKIPGKRAVRNGAKWNLETALIADGVKAADVYKVLATPAGVDRAFKKLDTIKKDLVYWKSGAQPPQMLAAGDVVMTTAYNGRVTAANDKDKKNFKMVWKGVRGSGKHALFLLILHARTSLFLLCAGRLHLHAACPRLTCCGSQKRSGCFSRRSLDSPCLPDDLQRNKIQVRRNPSK